MKCAPRPSNLGHNNCNLAALFRPSRPRILPAAAFAALLGSTVPVSAALVIADSVNDNVGLYDSTTGAAINANFISIQGPAGIAFGSDGDLYVGSPSLSGPDGAGVVKYNGATGSLLGTFVSHATDNSLNNPAGLAFGADGNLYVADLTGGFVLAYNHSGANVGTFTDANLGTPSGMVFDNSGTKLYIADVGLGNLVRYSSGSFSAVNTPPGQFNAAQGVALDGGGFAYVLDISGTGGVYKVNLLDGSYTKIIDYSTSTFNAAGIAMGLDGHLYVSGQDNGEGEVLRYATTGTGGSTFVDLGFNKSPGAMLFYTPLPEPAAWTCVGGISASLWAMRRRFGKNVRRGQ